MTPLLQIGLTWLLQSTALLGLGLLTLRLARGRGPVVQTLVGRAALVGVALLVVAAPLAGRVHPLWRVALPAEDRPTAFNSGGPETVPPVAVPSAPASPPNATPFPSSAGTLPQPVAPDPVPVPVSPLFRVYAALAALWVAGTLALLLWLGVCQWHLTRLRRAARPLTSGPAANALAGLTKTPPRLFAHPAVVSPFLAGVLRPAIFLPAEADFPPDTLRAILAHELAHLARRDNTWTLLSRLLCALLWPQPLLWLVCQRLEAVGEEACDLSVLARDCPPRAYAECLLSLAERWQPSRRERALGAGVAPLRSSVGRRIKQIMAAHRPLKGLTNGLRFSVASCALLAVSGSLLLLNAGADVDVPHFLWAKQQGWAVRPIRVIDLDHPGLTRVASLPYDISERDKATIQSLSDQEATFYGVSGPPVSERIRLESVLATRPHFFYAEYLLGSWYRQQGNMARASALQTQALRDAPVVLAGRYEYDDGMPLAGFQFGTSVLCYSPNHLKADNAEFRNIATRLRYPYVVTDADGCFYLPIFRAIYSQQEVSWDPHELNALTAPRWKVYTNLITPGPTTSGANTTGDESHLDKGFIAESHVAVMPQTEVRPQVALSTPFNAAEGYSEKPLLMTGSNLTLSWQPYPKAASYQVMIDEHHPHRDKNGRVSSDEWSKIRLSSNNPSRLGQPISQTSINLDFAGTDPVFNRTLPYTLTVQALDRNGELISQSDQYTFQPQNALAPQPLTKAAFAQALGPGFTVTSIQPQKDKVVVNAKTPVNFQLTPATDDAIENSGRIFGLGLAGWSSSGLTMNAANPAQQIQITYSRDAH